MSGISEWMQALRSSSQKFTPLHHHNMYHRCTAYWGMTSMSERTIEQEVCICVILTHSTDIGARSMTSTLVGKPRDKSKWH